MTEIKRENVRMQQFYNPLIFLCILYVVFLSKDLMIWVQNTTMNFNDWI